MWKKKTYEVIRPSARHNSRRFLSVSRMQIFKDTFANCAKSVNRWRLSRWTCDLRSKRVISIFRCRNYARSSTFTAAKSERRFRANRASCYLILRVYFVCFFFFTSKKTHARVCDFSRRFLRRSVTDAKRVLSRVVLSGVSLQRSVYARAATRESHYSSRTRVRERAWANERPIGGLHICDL